ncbi:hypothetical protein GCM10010124_35120 [Pilimelia terevasa]|uniref:AMP-dependent synthetase/ligase domain-containing protein n=1 Tax=Pilimelia terevasa TaxID=53372 RepID=A0A8J3FLW3_9ACTN|nr:TIGR03089 family protein [Pilimelia terevasa]GGK39379.1 hypothetical protein GCM10010124_35120 [Pilimelia terevasa]
MDEAPRSGTADVAAFLDRAPELSPVPFLTFLDHASGERVDVTAAALAAQAARTAVLLRDDCGVGPGGRCAVLLPPHWRSAAILLGCWAAGAAVEYRPWATAGLGRPAHADAVFVSGARLRSWLEEVPPGRHRFVVGLGGPAGEVPAGFWDFETAVRGLDAAAAPRPVFAAGAPASPDGTSHQEWGSLARAVADLAGLGRGDRVLVDVDDPANEQPVRWLLAPLSVGATVVLCTHADAAARARIAAEEGATHQWPAALGGG